MKEITTKRLNESFSWTKVCKIEPHFIEVCHDEDCEEKSMQIGHLDLILDNGERIRIDGEAYRPPEGYDDIGPLCTLRIRKADWKEVVR